VRSGIPVFPGALTPQEIYRARQAGAAMVKVFPAGYFGPKYFKEIKGPFADIPLLACGGVTPENVSDYFRHGADAAAFGASVFRKEWIERKDFGMIGEVIRRFVSAAVSALPPA
jgi:2-dehydro-3-deoxyphosphogluconate aldolase/(4S)-4-hydroxy-2-oxoglutarate aldolase